MVCKFTARTLLAMLSVAFWIMAFVLWIIGAYVIIDYRCYEEFATSKYTLVPAIIIIIIGIAFFLGGLLGFCAVVDNNKCSVRMFGAILVVITTLLIIACTFAFVYHGQVSENIRANTRNVVQHLYNGNANDSMVKQVDWLQQKLKCCGAENYTDWTNSSWYLETIIKRYPSLSLNVVPRSCCQKADTCLPASQDDYAIDDPDTIFNVGCYTKFESIFTSHLKLIGVTTLIIIMILVLGVLSSCALTRIYGKQDTPYYSLYS